MSADWFCKIGEKKVGPLNGQQLKTIVAKGQLKPEHLVRRGSEGPWVPAGRIKGLFPEGMAADAQPPGARRAPATAKPLSKAATLPTAAAVPAPPPSDIPQELMLGEGGHHHVEMNVDRLNIETTPVPISHRKIKTGLKGMKKDERKKVTVLLFSLIGGGLVIVLIAIAYALATRPGPALEEAKDPLATAPPVESGKKAEKETPKKSTPSQEEEKEPEYNKKATVDTVLVGNVNVAVNRPKRGAPPAGAKTDETYVLIVPVKLYLKAGETKPVELARWDSDSLKKKVLLKDDDKKSYALLEQVVDSESVGNGKTLTDQWTIVDLVFQAPTSKKLKFLHLALPSSAFQPAGPMIGFTINPNDINDKADEGDSKAGKSKGD